jgi:hypothetical protein
VTINRNVYFPHFERLSINNYHNKVSLFLRFHLANAFLVRGVQPGVSSSSPLFAFFCAYVSEPQVGRWCSDLEGTEEFRSVKFGDLWSTKEEHVSEYNFPITVR